jgi:hypothetical protein
MNSQEKVKVGLAATLAAITLAGLAYMVNLAWAQPTNLGPFQSQASITASATLAAFPANPSRRAFTICNGNASNSVTITFGTTLTPVSLTTGLVLLANTGGNINCYSNPGSVTGGMGAQINAIGSGAGPNIVTLLEY